MTAPLVPAPEVITAVPASTGVRISSTLCWVVGVLTILVAVAVGYPTAGQSVAAAASFAINLAAGIFACLAGMLVRQRRKLGALLLVIAWASPTVWSSVTGGGVRGGNFLLLIAMVMLLINWKQLR